MDDLNTPATKGDIRELRTEFKAELSALDQRWEGKNSVREQRMLGRVGGMIHDSETRLLQAFYGFAEATNKRLNQVDGNVAIFLNRLGTVGERCFKLKSA